MKKVYLSLIAFCFSFLTLQAQETAPQSSVDVTIQGNFVNRHIYRGFLIGKVGNSAYPVHLQPEMSLSYTGKSWGTATVGFFGTYGVTNEYSESDLYLTYGVPLKKGSLSFTLFDYHYPYSANGNFRNFEGGGNGAHTLELQASYTVSEKFPLNIFLGRLIHNYDPPQNDNSLYARLSYPFSLSDLQMEGFLGLAQGQSSWHAIDSSSPAVTNLGLSASRTVSLNEAFKLNYGTMWVYNPYHGQSFMQFRITIL